MDRRDFLKNTAAVGALAIIPFSAAPRPVVDVNISHSKYDDYDTIDWLKCRLILFDHRNRPMHSPPISAAHIGFQQFPVLLMSFYRIREDIKITAMQFVDRDGKVPFKPLPYSAHLVNGDTLHCTYRMERPCT